jgi:hypothetical protein
MTEDDFKDANRTLMNWGRYVNDGWLEHNLLYTPPPTSEGYVAPAVGFDELEPAKIPVDGLCGMISEHVVVSIGCEPDGFDHYRALVAWYTKLAFVDCVNEERYKRLSKRLHCAYPTAEVLLKDAQARFWQSRQVLDGLLKMCRTVCNPVKNP